MLPFDFMSSPRLLSNPAMRFPRGNRRTFSDALDRILVLQPCWPSELFWPDPELERVYSIPRGVDECERLAHEWQFIGMIAQSPRSGGMGVFAEVDRARAE
jgi:hypothetical protein